MDDDEPQNDVVHPRWRAAILMFAVVLLIIVLSAAPLVRGG